MATYHNIKKIGPGGFGEVWKVRRKEDNALCALKKLVSNDTESVKRFAREVRLISSLDHPYIVKIIGKRLDKTNNFYVMPLYRSSLKEELHELKNNEPRIIKIFTAVLDGIEYAHSQGVIHRDIKPENVLFNSDDDLVLTDFGLGRKIDSNSARITTTSDNLGTFFYIAPEQALSMKTSDEKVDIYSLGKLLYEMFTNDQFSWELDRLPPAIQMIVNRCTRRNPDERFESISELKQIWNSLFSIQKTETEIRKFAILRAQNSLKTSEAKELINLFLKHGKEPDALHDFLMQTEPEAVLSMYNINSDITKRLLIDFAKFTADKGWGFGYTDKIGNWCRKIFNIIPDQEVRPELVLCVMEVGRNHNRWHVLEIFSKMIADIKEDQEILILRAKLQEVPFYQRTQVASSINNKVFPEIAALFKEQS